MLFTIFSIFCGCTSFQIKKSKNERLLYYSDDSNYIVRKGTINLFSDKNASTAWIRVDVFQEDGTTFSRQHVFDKYSRDILIENGFWKVVDIGVEVTFKTAIKVFYELQKPPIVEISINGETYLNFEEGKRNLLQSIEDE